jgi:hypothetical protein
MIKIRFDVQNQVNRHEYFEAFNKQIKEGPINLVYHRYDGYDKYIKKNGFLDKRIVIGNVAKMYTENHVWYVDLDNISNNIAGKIIKSKNCFVNVFGTAKIKSPYTPYTHVQLYELNDVKIQGFSLIT